MEYIERGRNPPRELPQEKDTLDFLRVVKKEVFGLKRTPRFPGQETHVLRTFIVAIVSLLIISSAFVLFTDTFNLNLTGRSTFTQEAVTYQDNLNLDINSNQEYNWIPENYGQLTGLGVSGRLIIQEGGYARVYLGDKLIFDSSKTENLESITSGTSSGTNSLMSITGNVIEEIGQENLSSIISSEIKNITNITENISQENVTLIENPELNQTLNQTSNQTQEEPGNQGNIKEFDFSGVCIDTCDLSGINLSDESYNLRFEIEGARIVVKSIDYEILPVVAEENLTENISQENVTLANFTENITQQQAVIGQPVKWSKRISVQEENLDKSPKEIKFDVPLEAQNIQVKEIEKVQGQGVRGSENAIGEVAQVDEKKIKVDAEKLKTEEKDKGIEVSLNATVPEYEVTYETPAPQLQENEVSEFKKEITVTGSDVVHYTNVLAYVNLTENPRQRISLYWLVNGSRVVVENFTLTDSNGNGQGDRLEWIVPKLSEQRYEIIIEIIGAVHLDENYTFISDIYNETYKLDDIWSETIPSGHYVRVIFEQKLTNEKDITIFPRIVSGNPGIEIYEKDGKEIIAEFTNLRENEYNQVFLTNLQGEQDTFDLKIVDGSVEFDHILDPVGGCTAGVCTYNFTANETWAVPTGVTSINTSVWGGGAAGAGLAARGYSGGGGGGAFAFSVMSVTSGESLAVVVGKEVAGTTGAGVNGLPSFVKWQNTTTAVYADYGRGGTATACGVRGLSSNSIGTTKYSGGQCVYTSAALNGGGGGAGSTEDGGNTSTGVGGTGGILYGGNGGAGTDRGTGVSGSNFSGGGGGVRRQNSGSYAGGGGARGLVEIAYLAPIPTASFGTNPVEAYNDNDGSITFDLKCSSPGNSISTVQLWTNSTGTWHANYTNSSYANNTWLNITVTGIPEGGYVWAVWCNTSSGASDWTDTNRTFSHTVPDTTNPTAIQGQNPVDLYNDTDGSVTFDFKCYDNVAVSMVQLWTNTTGIWHANYSNSGYTNNTWLNITVPGIPGGQNYKWAVWCNDTVGLTNTTDNRTFSVDTEAPTFTTIPANASLFFSNQSLSVIFVATDNYQFGYYAINDSRFSITPGGLLTNASPMAVGDYEINVTINDSSNNIAWTRYKVQINKSLYYDCGVFFNTSSPIIYPATFTANTNCSTSYNLYLNGTGIANGSTVNAGAGYYNITVQRADNANYTNISDSRFFTVSKNTNNKCQVFYNATSPITHPDNFLAWSNCTTGFTLYLNGSVIGNNSVVNGGWGAYNISFLRTDVQNYSYVYNESQFRVLKSPSICGVFFNISSPINYPDTFTANTNCSTSYNLYLNGTGIANGSTVNAGAGYYNITAQRGDTSNYTSWFDQQFFTVSKSTEKCEVRYNTTSPVTYPDLYFVWQNCTTTTTLYRNGTTIGNNTVQNSGADAYNYSLFRTDTQNYSSVYNESQFRVLKSPEKFTVQYNTTSPIFYPDSFLVWANSTTALTLKRNDTTIGNNTEQRLGVSAYNFSALRTDTQNYTYLYNESQFRINKSLSMCGVFFNETSPIIYPKQFTGNTNCSSIYGLYLNGSAIGNGSTVNAGAGYYNITAQRTDNANYTDLFNSGYFTVSKSTENCQVLFNTTSPVEFPKTFLVWYNCTTTSTLYVNGTPTSNNTEQSKAVGAYNYSFLRTDTQNYSTYYNETQMIVIGSLNNPPVVETISSIPSQSITEQGETNVTFFANISDPNGLLNLDTVNATFNLTGQAIRENATCVNVTAFNSTLGNYSCTIRLWYWDAGGDWNVTVNAKDAEGNTASKVSTFVLGSTSAFVINPSTINWGTISPGSTNKLPSDYILMNNTGNENISAGGVQVRAYDLLGVPPNDNYFIPAANFSVSAFSGTDGCNTTATAMVNASYIAITGSALSIGNNTDGKGQSNLYYCIREVPSNIISQAYSTSGLGAWTIKIVALAVMIIPARRRKKKQITKEINEELSELTDLSRDKLELLETFMKIEKLKESREISTEDILEAIKAKKEGIPISIFDSRLAPSESLIKYLKENLSLSYHDIAELLNRDDRTIWATYQNASKKIKGKIEVSSKKVMLPISIFANRKMSILESLVSHLINKGFSYIEISKLTGKDQRNIWTIGSRAKKKLG
jgi:hypothetical protein